jgi:hypothetical protein
VGEEDRAGQDLVPNRCGCWLHRGRWKGPKEAGGRDPASLVPGAHTSARWWSAALLPGGCTGSTPTGQPAVRMRPPPRDPPVLNPPQSHPHDWVGHRVSLSTRREGNHGHQPQISPAVTLPARLPRPASSTTQRGASYRSPGVGRAPGAHPALLSQLRTNTVATWKISGGREC